SSVHIDPSRLNAALSVEERQVQPGIRSGFPLIVGLDARLRREVNLPEIRQNDGDIGNEYTTAQEVVPGSALGNDLRARAPASCGPVERSALQPVFLISERIPGVAGDPPAAGPVRHLAGQGDDRP